MVSPAVLASSKATAAASSQPGPDDASDTESTTAEEVPNDLVPPRLIQPLSFEYPEPLKSRAKPPFGTIRVKYVVKTDGSVDEIEVESGVDPRLDAAAVEAVRNMRYEPATYQGQPVELVLAIDIEVEDPGQSPREVDELDPERAAPDPDMDPAMDLAEPGIELPNEQSAGSGPVRISGVLLEAGQRTPIAGSTIIAIPAGGLPVGRIKKRLYEAEVQPEWTMAAQTSADGSYALRGVPNGKIRLIVQSMGFERLEYVVELGENDRLELEYYQTRASDDPYTTTVIVEREEDIEVTRHTLSREEITTIPGTQGDALKSIQNLPGVARAPFGAGLLVIRGARPSDSRTFFAHHEIPNLFHFGGLSSVVNSDVLQQIDFLPGNFDVKFGDAIGGIVNVASRKGRRDGYHGYIDSDLIDTGILFEGPVGKGSFILSGRRSYIDGLLNVAVPSDAPINFVLAPRYYDYQAFFDHPIGAWNLSIRGFGSDDQSKLIFAGENDEETDARNSIEQQISFHRADIELSRKTKRWQFMATPSYRYDFISFSAGDQIRADIRSHALSGRLEFAHRLGKRSMIRVGSHTEGGWFSLDIQAPTLGQQGSVEGDQQRTNSDQTFLFTALYSSVSIGLGDRLTLFPGVRSTYYSKPFDVFATDPRLRAALEVGPSTMLKAGVGKFSQVPTGQQVDEVFGNPNLGVEQSIHSSFGVTQDFPSNVRLEVTGFHKHIYNQVTNSREIVASEEGGIKPELFNNEGIGRAYGLEVLLRKSLTKNFFGWISYTLMRAESKNLDTEEFEILGQDQTHILTIIGSYKLPHHWQVGLRFRLTSGLPRTPVTDGVFDAASGSYLPVRGPVNSDRLPLFHQLDLRVDKSWIARTVQVTAYLDVQNVYNAANVETLIYDFDFKTTQPIIGLPILPSIGLKLEF